MTEPRGDRGLRRVGLVVHGGRAGAVEAARTLTRWLGQRGVAVRCLAGEGLTGEGVTGEGAEEREAATFPSGLDLVVSVGGDGTLLRAAQLANGGDVPLLGVKVGRLGFLTEVEPREAPELLAQVLEGAGRIEERMALVAHPVDAPWAESQWALNEVILEKTARHHLITRAAVVGGESVTRFSADGVIVATPTGSTAYSFSAGGPIVSPKLSCLTLTPVAPHMVFDRSMVLAPEEGVTLEVLGEEPGLLAADGRAPLEMPVGSKIRIERAPRPARLVRRDGSPSFFALLREKFSLPGEAPHGGDGPRWPEPPQDPTASGRTGPG